MFLSGNSSTAANLYGFVITELWITEFYGFKEDIMISFIMTNIYPFDVSSIEIVALVIYTFLLLKCLKT